MKTGTDFVTLNIMNLIENSLKMRVMNIFEQLLFTQEESVIEAIENILEKKDLSVPDTFYQELDKRRMAHKNGESTSYTWEEVKQNARKATQ